MAPILNNYAVCTPPSWRKRGGGVETAELFKVGSYFILTWSRVRETWNYLLKGGGGVYKANKVCAWVGVCEGGGGGVKLVVVYKYVYFLLLLYYITHMLRGYGYEHFDNMTLFPFQEQIAKEKIIQCFQYSEI